MRCMADQFDHARNSDGVKLVSQFANSAFREMRQELPATLRRSCRRSSEVGTHLKGAANSDGPKLDSGRTAASVIDHASIFQGVHDSASARVQLAFFVLAIARSSSCRVASCARRSASNGSM